MNKFLTFALLLFTIACQSKPEWKTMQSTAPREMAAMRAPSPEQSEPEADEEAPPSPPETSPQPQATANRKIIRNAQLRFRVNDFKASGKTIEQAVQQAGGQITSSNETKSYNTIENALIIRVPAARFDALLESVLKESIFTDTKSITAEDVTRRYVDTEARIRSKKAVEETYLKLLKQARNVEDVLKIEEQLAAIREDREVEEAELRQLKDEVSLSTINLTYYQQTEVALRPEEPFYAQIWHNLSDGFRLIGDVFIGAFYLLPLALVGWGVVWLFLRWRKKRRNVVK
ncbi:DUF4349 domain-containing protein [Spirosoma sp. BT702]|uniref:DUF4349 domain-containing protein n=1 Tax=Spirosoma profusum TaxID=2771354 RepID=A0A927ASS6_9BACT|nr:DUF4349 domain-containing protein [Spirosoma profusum]MBD2704366.1 DUF4349 domain-containing protein [Spirosoma profusum]